jgi:glycosyltransferase involved in cell wall biosynthesis
MPNRVMGGQDQTVHVVVPDGIDDPARPSGGNVYDRKVCDGLAVLGWSVRVRAVSGDWPWPGEVGYTALADQLAAVPDGDVVLLDGLVASTAPDVLRNSVNRLRLVLLIHLPIGAQWSDGAAGGGPEEAATREHRVLSIASAVIVTSAWARRFLLDSYALPEDRLHVVEPGVDVAGLARGTVAGGELLCVGAVTPVKGHDLLLTALGQLTDLSWHCRFVGAQTRHPAFVARLADQILDLGIGDRVALVGPLTGAELEIAYAATDLLVTPSRFETYGMVVTEALARGIPVVATDVGGVGQALGFGPDGDRPGRLTPPDDPTALALTLREWLGDDQLRSRLRRTAGQRRTVLPGWADTCARISDVLARVSR